MTANPLRAINANNGVAQFDPTKPLRPAESVSFAQELEQADKAGGGAGVSASSAASAQTTASASSQNTAAAIAALMTNNAVSGLFGDGSSGGSNLFGGTDTDMLSLLTQSASGTDSLTSSNLLSQLGGSTSTLQMLASLMQNNTSTQQNTLAQTLAGLLQSSGALTTKNLQNTNTNANALSTLITAIQNLKSASNVQAGSSNIPAEAWESASPATVNTLNERSPAAYRAVIDQFDVENNARYAVKNGNTYCNIFLWDVTKAMDAEIPHYTDPDTGDIVDRGTDGAQAMTANRISDWLNTHGARYGWVEATAEQAQMYANSGRPAMTVWKNPPGHGHVQVVCPSQDGTYNSEKGVTVAQAGRRLRNYTYISDIYGENTLSKVQYFVHA